MHEAMSRHTCSVGCTAASWELVPAMHRAIGTLHINGVKYTVVAPWAPTSLYGNSYSLRLYNSNRALKKQNENKHKLINV